MKYPFTVYKTKVENHEFWIAESPLLNGCVGQGDTQEEAILELQMNEEEWLATAIEYGIDIPEVPCEAIRECSGKFTVRCSPAVHRRAVELAEKQGISLNQYVNDAIVAQNSSISTLDYVMPAVKKAVEKVKMMAVTAISESKEISNASYTVMLPLSYGSPYSNSYIN
ncbi:MAG: type II toxin-antitoxin system HicB family antitoxin [Clostridia bacterium]|nr:type II toxin-antitoxin system HicB family antitoxin [Clostridia bacterium]